MKVDFAKYVHEYIGKYKFLESLSARALIGYILELPELGCNRCASAIRHQLLVFFQLQRFVFVSHLRNTVHNIVESKCIVWYTPFDYLEYCIQRLSFLLTRPVDGFHPDTDFTSFFPIDPTE